MMNAVFEQLAEALTYLGKKQIITLQLGNFSIQFDKAAMIMSWIVIGLLIVLALFLRRALRQDIEDDPNRVQAALDMLIDLLQGQLTSSFSSEKLAIEMFPFISTLFLFVLFSNWLGVVPGLSSPTQNLNITMGLALMVFVVSQTLAMKAKGMKAYWKGYLEPMPFMLPLNIISELSKPMSHAFRLFGNVLAGTILITVVMAKFAPIIVPSGLHLIFGLFFGGIQAFVFAILAVAYINVAVES
ncbi:F0F1 ATP synthase subunit A [Candidatus Bipolaricaulota bacterium]|nr:F0F1 ATP synthase subunit A [Candidatus Bipolaricaulota bacterium]